MTSYKTVQSATFLSLPSLAIVGVIYLVVTTVLTQALDLFERRLKRSERN
jgi:polar amino acid transport system permease protein